MSAGAACASLYFITAERALTRSRSIFPRSEMSASVMPSARYSCDGSRARLSSGSTASEVMSAPVPLVRPKPKRNAAAAIEAATATPASIVRGYRRRAGAGASSAASGSAVSACDCWAGDGLRARHASSSDRNA
jgi:hypothetical protein